MRLLSKFACGGLACAAVCLALRGICVAGTDDAAPSAAVPGGLDANPYSVIVQRNPFRLNPPPPAPEPDKMPAPNLPAVSLNGFTQTGGNLRVFLLVKTQNGDPKAPVLTSSLVLCEGQQQDGVELVKAYLDEGKVAIVNSGTPMTLSMKDNGVKGQAVLSPVQPRGGQPAEPRPPLLRRPSGSRPLPEIIEVPTQAGLMPDRRNPIFS